MALHGTSSRQSSNPVKRNAPAAINPHVAPAVPATVKARIMEVSGGHFRPKIAPKTARSRVRILCASPLKFLFAAPFRLSG